MRGTLLDLMNELGHHAQLNLLPRAKMVLRNRLFAVVLLSGLCAVNAGAQRTEPSGVRAFSIEAAGGTIGSLAGVVTGLAIARIDRCGDEDLSCNLSALAVGAIAGTIGATAGTVIAGRMNETRPSPIGAFAGAVAGAFAGVGAIHLLTEEANVRLNRPVVLVVFSLAQGLLTAAGSRIGASIGR
jgi:hypothetical protein